jgi:hypothetical protein
LQATVNAYAVSGRAASTSHGGQYGLSIPISPDKFDVGTTSAFFWTDKLCGGKGSGGLNAQGKTFTAWVYLDGPFDFQDDSYCELHYFSDDGDQPGGRTMNLARRQWFQLAVPLTSQPAGRLHGFSVSCRLRTSATEWMGQMLVDDVAIE